jgi:hypothetical protein
MDSFSSVQPRPQLVGAAFFLACRCNCIGTPEMHQVKKKHSYPLHTDFGVLDSFYKFEFQSE